MPKLPGPLALALALGCDPLFAQTLIPSLRGDGPVASAMAGGGAPLAVPGFGDAVVVAPDLDGPRPVVVAAHGNYDRPEWQCEVWRGLVAGRAWILCPRGVARRDSPSPRDVRFTYASQAAFNREVDAGLAALRRAYGARVGGGPIVYAGFSLGAILGVGYLRATAERVAAAALVEGGHSAWTADVARAFRRRGGAAVLFACGQSGCASAARGLQPRFAAAGVASDVAIARGAGHSYGGAVAAAMRPAFERLIAPALGPR
jgi:dienelactone hydrolase